VHATLSRREKLRPFTSSICVGVNIGESVLGTSAPGVVVKTGNACTVKGPEHYFEWLGAFQCAAAPIRDVHGGLAGVLDLTVEVGSFGFDAASVVGQYANAIENQLLQAQSSEHLVLHFQTTPALLGTPLEALAGVTTDGRVVWVNGVAERFIGALEAASERDVEHLIGCSISALLALARQGSPQPVRLLNGLTVWLAARLQARDGVDFRHAVATLPAGPPPEKMEPAPEPNAATLGEHNHKLFERTLAAHGGNVAKTARALGVSRGLVYRRLGLGKPTLTPSEPAGSIPLA
jgi:transcriptional regulator of acetoin/glycerol metabolism